MYYYLKIGPGNAVQAASALSGPINVAGWVAVTEAEYDAACAGTLTVYP